MLPADLLNHNEVAKLIDLAFTEDHVENDLTTQACQLGDKVIQAKIIAKQDTIACGAPLFEQIQKSAAHHLKSSPIKITSHFSEGATLKGGTTWLSLEGKAKDLLGVERTFLNFLIRMCGIASCTAELVRLTEGTACKVLHTRKTAPGHRRIDVYAHLTGGGAAHRLHLEDAILVKENHLRAVGNWQQLFDNLAPLRNKARFVEIEVTNLIELKHALVAKPDRIMLDNFSVQYVSKAVELFGSSVQLEASGGINLTNAKEYASTGVDYISVGWPTHSAKSADLSMLFEF